MASHRDTKESWSAYMRDYRKSNPAKMKAIDLKKKYGLPMEEYVEMLLDQKGVCKICKQPEIAIDHRTHKLRSLAVDHNHTTGDIRGLLCTTCNTAIGLLREDANLFEAASNYLKEASTSTLRKTNGN
tara:strand:- start:1740 stop:2123 length:384 start_codon:yes stop_codon:yes gene_type:complete